MVALTVVGEDALDLNALAGVTGKRPLEESSRGLLHLVRKYLRVALPGASINGDMHVLSADAALATPAVAVDAVTAALDLADFLGVEVDQTSGSGDLITPLWLLSSQGRPFGQAFPAKDQLYGGSVHSKSAAAPLPSPTSVTAAIR